MISFILFGAGDGLPPMMSGSSPPNDAENGSIVIFFGAVLIVILLIVRCSEKCSGEKTLHETFPTPSAATSIERRM